MRNYNFKSFYENKIMQEYREKIFPDQGEGDSRYYQKKDIKKTMNYDGENYADEDNYHTQNWPIFETRYNNGILEVHLGTATKSQLMNAANSEKSPDRRLKLGGQSYDYSYDSKTGKNLAVGKGKYASGFKFYPKEILSSLYTSMMKIAPQIIYDNKNSSIISFEPVYKWILDPEGESVRYGKERGFSISYGGEWKDFRMPLMINNLDRGLSLVVDEANKFFKKKDIKIVFEKKGPNIINKQHYEKFNLKAPEYEDYKSALAKDKKTQQQFAKDRAEMYKKPHLTPEFKDEIYDLLFKLNRRFEDGKFDKHDYNLYRDALFGIRSQGPLNYDGTPKNMGSYKGNLLTLDFIKNLLNSPDKISVQTPTLEPPKKELTKEPESVKPTKEPESVKPTEAPEKPKSKGGFFNWLMGRSK